MRVKRAASAILSATLVMACAVPAFAAEREEPVFTMDSSMVDVAAELFVDGDAFISSYGSSMDDKRTAFRMVQSYVDSVTTTSETPTVKCVIAHNGKEDEQVRFSLIYPDGGYTDEELDALLAEAGNTAESINNFLTARLSYDRSGDAVSASSPSATARGSLNTGKAICMGYTNAFSVLAEHAGIKFVKVRGYVKGEYHVLNVIEGGFTVDVTFNDNTNNRYLMAPFDDYCNATGFTPEINIDAAFRLKYGSSNGLPPIFPPPA